MIYRLLFGEYLARNVVLIMLVGISLHQGFLTLRVLNLSFFCSELHTNKTVHIYY